MNLVIVESPSKAKTINKYLGKDYTVRASKGHIVDLPKSKIGIDIENNFQPQYEVTNKKALAELKHLFKDADKLILAVDLDREGEAIAWHIARELKVMDENGKIKGKKPIERIVFHEISKDAIQTALKSPRAVDMNLVNSQQGRRLLDRIVGYKLSPLLWKKISFGLSAGRVQSVAVRLIVEREEERNKFKADEYWDIIANLANSQKKKIVLEYKLQNDDKEMLSDESKTDKKKLDTIPFKLSKINQKDPNFIKQEECGIVVNYVKDKQWVISDIITQQSKRNTKPPFITSTLQQTAVNWLGFSAKRTMQAAQKLYEAGYITYMRTDSVLMSNDAINQARAYVKKNFGEKYIPKTNNYYKSSNKSAQEAHECVRPVNFSQTSSSLGLDGDLKRVYDLIWQRTLASQMVPAEVESISLVINIDKYEFRSTGKRILFEGFLKVYPEKLNENILPKYEKGAKLFPQSIVSAQHFTQPPARYSEATLIKKLEELGIGRPSTYASIISTIISRKYVINENKYLSPTDTGIVVNKLLEKYFGDIVDYNFTAEMENKLDKIAEGKLDWKKMLKDFYYPFEKNVIKQDKNIERSEFTELGKSDQKCPICGKPMVIKLGRFGKFLSCTDFPKCKGMLSMDGKSDQDIAKEAQDSVFKETYEEAPKAEDGTSYILKQGRFGKFWAHPNYPKVKDAQPLVLKHDKMIELYGEIPKTKDGKDYLLKKGKFGEFWAHPNYPAEKDIIRIKKQKKIENTPE